MQWFKYLDVRRWRRAYRTIRFWEAFGPDVAVAAHRNLSIEDLMAHAVRQWQDASRTLLPRRYQRLVARLQEEGVAIPDFNVFDQEWHGPHALVWIPLRTVVKILPVGIEKRGRPRSLKLLWEIHPQILRAASPALQAALRSFETDLALATKFAEEALQWGARLESDDKSTKA